jgi:hypothetical protein
MSRACDEETKPSCPSEFGRVLDSENICRVVFSPDHVGDSNSIKHAWIPSSELKDGRLSVSRVEHVTPEALQVTVNIWKRKNADREVAGVGVVNVTTVRAISYDDGEKALCVYEDPEPDNPAHAHKGLVWRGPAFAKKMRDKLIREFKLCVSIEDVVS